MTRKQSGLTDVRRLLLIVYVEMFSLTEWNLGIALVKTENMNRRITCVGIKLLNICIITNKYSFYCCPKQKFNMKYLQDR